MPEYTVPGNRPESSVLIWNQLAESLEKSGFSAAGPEYLKLARLVLDARKRQLLQESATTDEASWKRLSDSARRVQTLLEPMFEASRMVAQLPIKMTVQEPEPIRAVEGSSATAKVAKPIRAKSPSKTMAADPSAVSKGATKTKSVKNSLPEPKSVRRGKTSASPDAVSKQSAKKGPAARGRR